MAQQGLGVATDRARESPSVADVGGAGGSRFDVGIPGRRSPTAVLDATVGELAGFVALALILLGAVGGFLAS